MLSAALLTAGQYAGAAVVLVSFVVIMWKAVRFFNRYEERQQNMEHMLAATKDQIAIMGSLQDLIDQPMMMLDAHGQVTSINMACHRLLGYSADELKNGFWKPKLDWNSQVEWETAIREKTHFDRVCQVAAKGRRLRVTLIAKAIKPEGKLLGWRVSIDHMGRTLEES